MDNNWINHPALKNMDKRKKQVLTTLMNETNGKPMNQALPHFLKANNTLRSQGLSFTQSESSAIMDVLTKDMKPEELSRFNSMKQMMSSMRSKKS